MGTNIFLPFSLKALSSRWWFRISKGGIWTVSSLEGISHSYRRLIHQFFLKWRTWLNKWCEPLGGQEFRKCKKNNDWRWTWNRFHHQPVKHHPPAGNQSPTTREWLGQHEMIYKVLFRTLLDGFFGPKKQTCQKQISNPVRRQNNQKFNEIHQLKDILVFFGMEHPSKRICFKTGPQGKSEVLLARFFFKNHPWTGEFLKIQELRIPESF